MQRVSIGGSTSYANVSTFGGRSQSINTKNEELRTKS